MSGAIRFDDVRAILFDLDGTLADTAPDLGGAINAMRRARGLAEVPHEQLRPVASMGARGLLGVGFSIAPADPGYDGLRDEFLTRYAADICVHSRLFAGVESLLALISAHGISWGIVTNKAHRLTTPLVSQIGLSHAAVVVSGDTTPHSKPHPAPLLHAAEALGIAASRCIYVGDDLRDIQAGHAAHMQTIAAAWGYCAGSSPQSWDATLIVDTPSQLADLIGSTL